MGQYPTDTCVTIYPFTRQPDGEEIVIGHPHTATFLALPPDAIEMLDHLSQDKTIGETQQIYQQKYGELPEPRSIVPGACVVLKELLTFIHLGLGCGL